MKKFILIITFCAGSIVVEAKCPGEIDDGKRVTVAGKLAYAEGRNGKYLFGVEQCQVLIHAKSNGNGACKLGRTLTATGTYYLCDPGDGCFKDIGDMDMMDANKISCR
jgi:hypothetical protein